MVQEKHLVQIILYDIVEPESNMLDYFLSSIAKLAEFIKEMSEDNTGALFIILPTRHKNIFSTNRSLRGE